MKFDADKVNGVTAGLCIIGDDVGRAAINGSVEAVEIILRAYSSICGEKTKQRLMDAIKGRVIEISSEHKERAHFGIDYSDTRIRGRHYVYLWFDCTGDLFYIGKGIHDRAINMYGRTEEFKERAKDGNCCYVAYNLDEIYALDLERILIWEAALSGKQLLNVNGGNGVEAIQYCKQDRDMLLWYWNHEGTIDRFSELTGIRALYNVGDTKMRDAIESRKIWWDGWGQKTNDPVVLEGVRKAEEKKQKQREYYKNRRKNRSDIQ